jgi:glycosyltransferase involved in cell wall biosynthesis
MLLELLAALPDPSVAEVWLPTDLAHPSISLCAELDRRGISNRHVDLPILRRAYRTPRTLVALARRTVALNRHLRAARPAIVYCTTSAAFIAAPIARLSRVPRVVGHLQEIWSRGDRWILRPMARCCDSLIAISDAVAASVPAAVRSRTTVVPNGTPEPRSRTPLVGRTGRLQFLVASRWNGWKGHRTLLAAWDALPDPGHLVILGGPPSSGDPVDVVALAKDLNHPDSVSLIGEVADPSVYLDEADVILMPSDRPEPFGLIAIEAFARGRPVIASAAGGLLDIVTNASNGWLFPPGDAISLAAVLSGLDRRVVEVAGDLARETYLERYTAAAFAARWRAAMHLSA